MHPHDAPPTAQPSVPENLYAPPKAAIADPLAVGSAPEFYVVGSGKFLILYFATLGAYQLYWFWKHWALQRARHQLKVWPVPRALFSIFFAHALNARITGRLEQRGLAYAWSPGGWATLYVVCVILGQILDRVAASGTGWPVTSIIALAMLLPAGLSLAKAQRAANTACDDPDGQRNERLTPANYVWILLGVLLWALVLFGLTIPPEELS